MELQAKLAHEQSEAALKQKISVMVKDVLEASGEGATRLSAPSSPKKAPTMGTNELTDLIQRKNDEIEQLRSQLAALSIPSSPIDMNRRRSSQISLNADSDPDAVFKALVCKQSVIGSRLETIYFAVTNRIKKGRSTWLQNVNTWQIYRIAVQRLVLFE